MTGFLPCLLGLLICTSCVKDEWEGKGNTTEQGKLTINVGKADLVVKNPMSTRAASDFEKVKDLNLVVANGEGKIDVIYYWSEENSASSDPGWNTSSSDTDVIASIVLDAKDYSAYSFLLLANHGSKLEKSMTLTAIRQIKDGPSMQNQGVPVSDKLFVEKSGKEIQFTSGTDTPNILNMELERTVAMITVALENKNMKGGITIEPRRISLYNVPTSCYVGMPNNADATVPNIEHVKAGESKSVLYNWGTLSSENTKIGGHAGEYLDYALFLYENIHNSGFGAQDGRETWKRPAGVDADKDKLKAYLDKDGCTCSYLEVEAIYRNTDDHAYGTIKYRFLLGENITDNFDVKRNTHYQITLTLSGTAATEGGQFNDKGEFVVDGNQPGATWRVESDLDNPAILSDGVQINGSGEYIHLPMAGQAGKEWSVTLEEYGTYGIGWIYGKSSGGDMWQSINTAGFGSGTVSGTIDADMEKNGLWIYIQPWLPGLNGEVYPLSRENIYNHIKEQKKISRTLTINFTVDKRTQKIDVVQYLPCAFRLTEEEAKRIFGDQNLHYENKYLYMFLERVDHEPLSWGFSGHVLDDNQAEGFQNSYHLIAKAKGHEDHYRVAEEYLPWGKHPYNGDNGSAMINAIQYHLGYPQGKPNFDVSPDQYFQKPDNVFDGDAINDFGTAALAYYWAIPSIEEWQAIEKALLGGQLADANLSPEQYWTSDAVTTNVQISDGKYEDGKTHAFTYQLGKELDKVTAEGTYPKEQRALRSKSLPYRLIGLVKFLSDKN